MEDLLKDRIEPLIVDSLRSVETKLNQTQRKFCMEIFGYDFILDSNCNPWLIEVNTNPCLEESSKLLKVLIPRMIDDALKLTLDVVFPSKKVPKPSQEPKEDSPTHIDDSFVSLVIGSEPGIG